MERWARIGYTHSACDFEAFQPRVSTALWKLLYEGNPELAFTRLPYDEPRTRLRRTARVRLRRLLVTIPHGSKFFCKLVF